MSNDAHWHHFGPEVVATSLSHAPFTFPLPPS